MSVPQGSAENAVRPMEEACQRPVSSGATGSNGSRAVFCSTEISGSSAAIADEARLMVRVIAGALSSHAGAVVTFVTALTD